MKAKKPEFKSAMIPLTIIDTQLYAFTMIPSSPKYGGILPQMAKGDIDSGEQPLQAAIREGNEELGLISDNIQETFTVSVEVFDNTTIHIFACTLKDSEHWGTPHYETGSTLWVNLETQLHRLRPKQRNIFKKLLANKQKFT